MRLSISHRVIKIFAVAFALLLSTGGAIAAAAPEPSSADRSPAIAGTAGELRRFTVQDSIALAAFTYPAAGFGRQPSHVGFSPDGAHFVVATLRGDLASGQREATLWLFDSRTVRQYLSAPASGDFSAMKPLARFASAANRDPISDWRWSSDSRSVLFLGADDDGVKRLYRVGVGGGGAVAVSRADQDISRYDEANGAIVYLAHPPIRAGDLYQAGGPALPDMEVATGKNILPLLFPNWLEANFNESADELWRVEDGKPVPVIDTALDRPVQLKNSKLALSPDGRQAIVTRFVTRIPPSWERYRPLYEASWARILADTPETEGATGHYRPQQYVLVDLASGQESLLIDAPIELRTRSSSILPQWNEDGARVAVLGAYPPIDASAESQPAASVLPCEIMMVDVRTKTPSCVRPATPDDGALLPGDRKQIVALKWQDGGRALVAQYASRNAPDRKSATTFRQDGGSWQPLSAEATPLSDELVVEVQQALDAPPILTARLGRGPARRLFDPNPQLQDIALGKAALYHWRDADGEAWSGALVTPPDFAPDRRYPLVIQTHNLDRDRFLVDGPSATGFAARALAARGMVVLQVDEIRKNFGTFKESETGAGGYRAAIKQLASEGVVDPTKVGIITWSHMGPYVMRALIDEPQAYAAATFAEASDTSYGEYLMNIDYMGREREQMFREQVGAKPFGEGLKLWLDRSPGFQTDRVCTPTLWQMNSPVALVYGWNSYSALRAQNKPVELFYIRGGDHVLVKPRQRLAEQGMNVDWYDYWLNGHKDPDPAKAAQYKRWDAMKARPRCGDAAVKASQSLPAR